MFWALWQQNFSSWVIQAEKMDRHLFGVQLAAGANPDRQSHLHPHPVAAVFLRDLSCGRAIGEGDATPAIWRRAVGGGRAAFMIIDWIQTRIDAGQHPHILWQILAFVVLTAGEVMLSVTHLEFAYTQAPKKMKSLVMCTYLGSISLGNAFTAGGELLHSESGREREIERRSIFPVLCHRHAGNGTFVPPRQPVLSWQNLHSR